jgi:protoheme IX farnesyltransferase
VRDYLVLTKPEIVAMTLLTAAAGIGLGPSPVPWSTWVAALAGTGLCVASADVLNMVLERDTDRLMVRTKDRPLPAGRMRPSTALAFGIGLGALSLAIHLWLVNPLTALFGAVGWATYVLVYTPLKRRTPHALVVGAVAGAMPPLMGCTAVTGRITAAALALFAILFVWQVPHFLAIALFRKQDYARASIRTAPLVWGDRATKLHVVGWSLALLVSSLALVPIGAAGLPYALVAGPVGAWLLAKSLRGLREPTAPGFARGLFRASLVYLPVLALGIFADAAAH